MEKFSPATRLRFTEYYQIFFRNMASVSESVSVSDRYKNKIHQFCDGHDQYQHWRIHCRRLLTMTIFTIIVFWVIPSTTRQPSFPTNRWKRTNYTKVVGCKVWAVKKTSIRYIVLIYFKYIKSFNRVFIFYYAKNTWTFHYTNSSFI